MSLKVECSGLLKGSVGVGRLLEGLLRLLGLRAGYLVLRRNGALGRHDCGIRVGSLVFEVITLCWVKQGEKKEVIFVYSATLQI